MSPLSPSTLRAIDRHCALTVASNPAASPEYRRAALLRVEWLTLLLARDLGEGLAPDNDVVVRVMGFGRTLPEGGAE